MPNIKYKINAIPDTSLIIDLYQNAGLNRPTADADRTEAMYNNSNLIISAWSEEKLVGIARSVTDFHYCCYLSDLAVHPEFQKLGIGKSLIDKTKEKVSDNSMLLLLSAPNAMGYYPKLGFDSVENGFIIKRRV